MFFRGLKSLLIVPLAALTALNVGFAAELPAATQLPQTALESSASRASAERPDASSLAAAVGTGDLPDASPVPHEVIVRRLSISNSLLASLDGDGKVTLAALIDGATPEELLEGATEWKDWANLVQVSVGSNHVVGLTADGEVLGAGVNHGQLACAGLTGVRQVVAGEERTACVMDDGRVQLYGLFGDAYGQLSQVENVKQIAASETHVIVLHWDGTVQAFAMLEASGQEGCRVEAWSNLKQVDAGYNYTVGVCNNGAVVYAGEADGMVDQCATWRNIEEVSAGNGYILGLKSNRKVASAGNPAFEFVRVGDWHYMLEVAAGYRQCVGMNWKGELIRTGD